MHHIKANAMIPLWSCALVLLAQPVRSQKLDLSEMQKGAHFIKTVEYSDQENARLLKCYEGLRVADISDGMDFVGLPNVGLVDPSIRPLWKDITGFTHQIRGIALTVRFVPSQQPIHPSDNVDYRQWESDWYSRLSSEPFVALIQKGQLIIIDDVEEADIGSIGSNNILVWKKQGAVGVITDASARDTDEIEKERVPLYFRKPGRGIRPGRNELECVNCPISVGGVMVRPGDVVVADSDGIVVVPRSVAEDVANYARTILEKDKAGRKKLYESMGIPKDQTVE